MRPPPPRGRVVVIGGANVDVKCQARDAVVAATSNPGRVRSAPGGVARNVAENLARLDVETHLVTAVGRDAEGDRLLAESSAAGVRVDAVWRTDAPTGVYVAVLDPAGELVVAVSATDALDAVSADDVTARRALVESAALLVLDCNLPVPALAAALRLARDAGVPVMIDPVSVSKAGRLRALPGDAPIHTVTPNHAELAALVGADALGAGDVERAAATLHATGVAHVWVRLGAAGSMLVSAAAPGATRLAAPGRGAPRAGDVVDVTGAGDAMLAGYAWATLRGHAPDEAARWGHAAAALTVADERTVSLRMCAASLAAARADLA